MFWKRKPLKVASPEGRKAISELFKRGGPALVLVYWPRCGTSSEWHLVEDEQAFQELIQKVGQAHISVDRVDDLQKSPNALDLEI